MFTLFMIWLAVGYVVAVYTYSERDRRLKEMEE